MGAGSSPGCSTSNPALCRGLGKQKKMAQVLGSLHPRGRPRRSSWLLASSRPHPSCCSHLESEPVDGRPLSLSPSLPLSLCPSVPLSLSPSLPLSLCLSHRWVFREDDVEGRPGCCVRSIGVGIPAPETPRVFLYNKASPSPSSPRLSAGDGDAYVMDKEFLINRSSAASGGEDWRKQAAARLGPPGGPVPRGLRQPCAPPAASCMEPGAGDAFSLHQPRCQQTHRGATSPRRPSHRSPGREVAARSGTSTRPVLHWGSHQCPRDSGLGRWRRCRDRPALEAGRPFSLLSPCQWRWKSLSVTSAALKRVLGSCTFSDPAAWRVVSQPPAAHSAPEKPASTAILCNTCGNVCRGEVLRVQNRYFHIKCFVCKACGCDLAEGGFFVRQGEYICTLDYQRLYGTRCFCCDQFIEGEVVSALGRTYHPDCFVCAVCR
uniref:LIM zinc-binding domain-containing protein n=1 Tax=Oryctolagus cuniculus TaxID=9986 RepID=A0A5F9CAC0_RABIT